MPQIELKIKRALGLFSGGIVAAPYNKVEKKSLEGRG